MQFKTITMAMLALLVTQSMSAQSSSSSSSQKKEPYSAEELEIIIDESGLTKNEITTLSDLKDKTFRAWKKWESEGKKDTDRTLMDSTKHNLEKFALQHDIATLYFT